MNYGVPQGSVLGARIYTMYVQPLSRIIVQHGIQYHCYADDTQLYVDCDDNSQAIQNSIARIQNCIADICLWMSNDTLKLNASKTELIIFTTKQDAHIGEH